MADKTPVPGNPAGLTFKGPWLQTQLYLSLAIGGISFLVFCYARTRAGVIYAPRTKLKGFSPSEAQYESSNRFFGWILPTIRVSEFTVLQVVGLDAAVLLNFFKMSFFLFSSCSLAAGLILIPYNLKFNGGFDSQPEDNATFIPPASILYTYKALATSPLPEFKGNSTTPPKQIPSIIEILTDPTTSLTLHLGFTYLFTILSLWFLLSNFRKFISTRQLFSLELIHSVSARTVLVSALPNYLRGERNLAAYFENMGWGVESVSVCREIKPLEPLIKKRTDAMLNLESAWYSFVGNPSKYEAYNPIDYSPLSSSRVATPPATSPPATLIPGLENESTTQLSFNNGNSEVNETTRLLEAPPLRPRLEIPGRKRPTVFSWLSLLGLRKKIDAIEHWETEFIKWDEEVKKERRVGKFEASGAAFCTFENMRDAQTAAQVVHCPQSRRCLTCAAPEPRDVVWANIGKSENSRFTRQFIIMTFMTGLLLFWTIPVFGLAALLSYKEIRNFAPWLADLIDKSSHTQAFVQNTLPSFALTGFNSMLPYLLESLSFAQGLQAKSWIEYSLLKKYHLFLLFTVILVFNVSTTFWALFRDLAGEPMKIPEKLAQTLRNQRHFFMSYVVLQSIGIMPFQLLNLSSVLVVAFQRAFFTRTPRDFAELNAPPMLNYGTIYPSALLVFTITIMYSVISPLVLVFGAAYFGFGYLVYKYKLLFVYYKPYESNGQAWPLSFSRLLLGVVFFQFFMTGLFLLQKAFITSALMVPLLIATVIWGYQVTKSFGPLSEHVAISSICEVQQGESVENVLRLADDAQHVSRSQTNLNKKRYAINTEDLYLAPEDERTDYSQPPMNGYYPGVLNSGRRRYAHPALSGILPSPWLPMRHGHSLRNQYAPGENGEDDEEEGQQKSTRKRRPFSVVLSLRRRVSRLRKGLGKGVEVHGGTTTPSKAPPHATRESSVAVANGGDDDDEGGATAGGPVAMISPHPDHPGHSDLEAEEERNPWASSSISTMSGGERAWLERRLSFDPATGIIMLPHSDGSDSESEDILESNHRPADSHTPYFPHPERSRTLSNARRGSKVL